MSEQARARGAIDERMTNEVRQNAVRDRTPALPGPDWKRDAADRSRLARDSEDQLAAQAKANERRQRQQGIDEAQGRHEAKVSEGRRVAANGTPEAIADGTLAHWFKQKDIAEYVGLRPHEALAGISRDTGVPIEHLIESLRRGGHNTSFALPKHLPHQFLDRLPDGRWAPLSPEAAATRERLYGIRREQLEKYGQPEVPPNWRPD